MIDLKQTSALGDTVAEYLEFLPYDLDMDGEGLWRIIPAGRSFGFENGNLTEFVRLCVVRLLESGGVPVRHADDGVLEWREQTQYGSGKDQIADAIVAEWLATGGGNPEWEWLWFVTRNVLKTARRWQADVQS